LFLISPISPLHPKKYLYFLQLLMSIVSVIDSTVFDQSAEFFIEAVDLIVKHSQFQI